MRRRSTPPCPDGGRPAASLFRALGRPALAYEADPAPTVTSVNPRFADVDGVANVEPGAALGEALAALGVPETARATVERVAADGERLERTVDRGTDQVTLRVVPAPDTGDPTRGFVLVESDADARADRLETFARVVSHDLRNPLDVARIRLDAAEESGEAVHFEKVRDAYDRIERIASDVLLLTDPAATVNAVDLDLATVVEDAWETVDTGDATLSVEATPTVQADAAHLQRLLENLFRNAAEHAGPDVTVRVDTAADGFFVADDGPGIDDAAADRLFEPGESDDGGSGLGLAVVRRIAAAHGWTVDLEESEDGGARFTFEGVALTEE